MPTVQPLVKVGNTPLSTSAKYTATISTIVDSSRNVEGQMVGAVVRADVYKVELNWSYLPAAEWASICQLFKGMDKFKQKVTFFAEDANGWITRTMYVSDRTAEAYVAFEENGGITGWQNCRLALIEV